MIDKSKTAEVKYLGNSKGFRYRGLLTGKEYMLNNQEYRPVLLEDVPPMVGGNFDIKNYKPEKKEKKEDKTEEDKKPAENVKKRKKRVVTA